MEKIHEHTSLLTDFSAKLSITRGPKFFAGKKHSTNAERAAVMAEYAARQEGVLREAFLFFAREHLQADEAVNQAFANATGAAGNTDTVEWLGCGSCATGRFQITFVAGIPDDPLCVACSPSGNPAGIGPGPV